MTENSSADILGTIEYFIEKIQNLRKVMLGVSMSALFLAPFAIGISVYLMSHPRFFVVLETESDFGLFLSILLGGIIIISIIWLYTGVRQYFSLNSWNKRYSGYLKKKEDLDKTISQEYHLGQD